MSGTAQDISTSQTSSQQDNGEEEEFVRQPKRTVMACSFCRGRKIKCDGARPLCGNCSKRTQPCVYTAVPKN